MARTKWIPKSRPSQLAKRDAPQETAKREAWIATIELGASNGQAMVKKPGGHWELVRWAQGVSASSVGGAEAIPALTAIRKQGQPREVLHGHAAVRARKRNPGDWEMFAYPKLVFIDEGTTPDIQRTLELQKEKAEALGMTSKEVAVAFFRHMISEVIGQRDETFKIYMNISDRWPNSNVQELMLSLQGLRTDAQFEHVDECLSSIIGCISSSAGSESAGGVYVVVDCGHSGMNVGLAEVADGPIYKVHRYKEYPAGAGEINMAVEDAVRSINRVNGANSADMNVWEVSECIDEYYKPEPEAEISPRCGLSGEEWETVMGRADLANRSLDRRRPNLARAILTEARDLANRLANDFGLHVLLTGRGARSPTLQKAFQNLVSQDFTMASLLDDKENHITAVLAGLMRIADDPGVLSVTEVPVSLWLRSDPDETTGEDDGITVVRICTQGQDTNDTVSVRDRVSASHPVHYELCAADDKPPSLDLSVFGTPAGVSDEEIIEGWNIENFAYTDVGKVTEFGRFEQELPNSTVTSSRRICHLYLYVKVSRLSVELYAIFADDGRAVKPLEKTPFDKAFQNGELTTKWKKYQGVSLRIVRLKQVARPESLSTNVRQPSTSRSQQSAATTDDDSPSDGSAMQPDVIQVSQRSKKRKPSLSKSGQAKQRKMSRLPAAERRLDSNEDELDSRSTDDDDTGSEMVL